MIIMIAVECNHIGKSLYFLIVTGRIQESGILVLPFDVMNTDSHKTAVDAVLQRFTKVRIK